MTAGDRVARGSEAPDDRTWMRWRRQRPPTAIADLISLGIAAVESRGEGDPAQLLDAEQAGLGGAAPGRIREFAAGRICARHALRRFGHDAFPLLALPDGRPRWPQGITGSITHTQGFAAAAVTVQGRYRAIGIDAERIGRMSNTVIGETLSTDEQIWADGFLGKDQSRAATLFFSAKEAFFKCQYEITQQWLDFDAVAVEIVGSRLDRGCCLVRPLGDVDLFKQYPGAAVVHFSCRGDLVTTAMVVAAG